MAYFDHAATTPVREEAVQASVEAMRTGWGNPSAQYGFGTRAAAQLRGWRDEVARGLGCEAGNVYFTSGGTESNNWAIQAGAAMGRGRHIVTTAIEHAAVLATCKAMEDRGYTVTYLTPDREGSIDAQAVERALRPDTVLVSMMLVNNELGSILPVAETAQAIRRAGVPALLHCDGVQGFLKIPFTPQSLGVDLLSVSGHKIHAPKGVGALYVRPGLRLPPLLFGGGQEGGLRSGTEATAQIAAFGAAVGAGCAAQARDMAHMQGLKDYAIARFAKELPALMLLNRGGAPHILPVSLPGYKSEVLVRFLSDKGIQLSAGSACHRGRPSHVYGALKLPKAVLDGVLRISVSYDTTQEDVETLVQGLLAAQRELLPSMS